MNKSKPIWKELLHEIYVASPNRYCGDMNFPFNSNKHTLARKLGIGGDLLMVNIIFLEENELIEKIGYIDTKGNYSELKLTKRGFDVASQNELNGQTLSFTKILAVAASFQALWLVFVFLYTGQKFVFDSVFQSIITIIIIVLGAWLLGKLIDLSIDAFRR